MNIYPSIISSNLLELGLVLSRCAPYCDGFHIDIMDNHFVPNLTWGLSFVESFVKATSLPLHIHCMVDDPLSWAKKIKLRTSDYFIFHYEALSSSHEIEEISNVVKAKNFKLGIALNPDTSVDVLSPHLSFLDHILLMSVHPGFSGQECIEAVFDKIDEAHKLCVHHSHVTLSIDGGIKEKHLSLLKNKKVDGVAMASAIFHSSSPIETLKRISSVAKKNF